MISAVTGREGREGGWMGGRMDGWEVGIAVYVCVTNNGF